MCISFIPVVYKFSQQPHSVVFLINPSMSNRLAPPQPSRSGRGSGRSEPHEVPQLLVCTSEARVDTRASGQTSNVRGRAPHGVAVRHAAAARGHEALHVEVPGPGQGPERAFDVTDEFALRSDPFGSHLEWS